MKFHPAITDALEDRLRDARYAAGAVDARILNLRGELARAEQDAAQWREEADQLVYLLAVAGILHCQYYACEQFTLIEPCAYNGAPYWCPKHLLQAYSSDLDEPGDDEQPATDGAIVEMASPPVRRAIHETLLASVREQDRVYTDEQLDGLACVECGRDFQRGQTSRPTGTFFRGAQLFAHMTCPTIITPATGAPS